VCELLLSLSTVSLLLSLFVMVINCSDVFLEARPRNSGHRAWYTLATKLNSTRSTLLKVETGNKSATKSTVADTVDVAADAVDVAADAVDVAADAVDVAASVYRAKATKSTVLNSILSSVCPELKE